MGASDEAMLSAQERAALAQLEARAAADDPKLADQLRDGQLRRRPGVRRPRTARLPAALEQWWTALRPAVWGPLLVVAGLLLVVAGLSVSLPLGVLGIALLTGGVALIVDVVALRLRVIRAAQPSPDSLDD